MVVTRIQPITPTTISRRIHVIIWQNPRCYQSLKGELLLFPRVRLTGPLRRNSPRSLPTPAGNLTRELTYLGEGGGEQARSFIPCVGRLLTPYGHPLFYTHTWYTNGWSLSVPAVIGWGRETFQEILGRAKGVPSLNRSHSRTERIYSRCKIELRKSDPISGEDIEQACVNWCLLIVQGGSLHLTCTPSGEIML